LFQFHFTCASNWNETEIKLFCFSFILHVRLALYTYTAIYSQTAALAEDMLLVLSRSFVDRRHARSLCAIILEPDKYKCWGTSDLLGCHFQYSTVDWPRRAATQAASLCTYIRACLIQVSEHVRLIHQHRHRPVFVNNKYRYHTSGKSPTGTPLIIF